jgi:predicted transcriptional regulator
MDKKLLELAVGIVQAQVALSKMTSEEIEATLLRTYNALHRMEQAENEGRSIHMAEEGVDEPDVKVEGGEKADPRSSVQEDKVICLECAAEFRQLTANHLRTHGLTPREYKRKWGFPLKQPLAARVLTKLRSRSAKKRGLPVKLQQYLEDQRQKKSASGAPEPVEAKPVTRRVVRRRTAQA